MIEIIKQCETVYECPSCGRKFLTERGAKIHLSFHCKNEHKRIVKKIEKSKELLGIPLFD